LDDDEEGGEEQSAHRNNCGILDNASIEAEEKKLVYISYGLYKSFYSPNKVIIHLSIMIYMLGLQVHR